MDNGSITIDEITEVQMKQVEERKMENDYTIKMLERQFLETQRNLSYTRKKLQLAQQESTEQKKTISQLSRANKAIVEKFHELKQYQIGFVSINWSHAKKLYDNSKEEIHELSKVFGTIIIKDDHLKCLNESILKKNSELNENIQRQIGQRQNVIIDLDERISQINKKMEILHKQLSQETSDNSLKISIEEKNKRILQLEAEQETFQKKHKLEVDEFLQTRKNKLQELQNNKKNLEEKKDLIPKLQSELSIFAENENKHKEEFLNLEAQKKAILEKVTKNREKIDVSKKAFAENFTNINNEQAKLKSNLQIVNDNFTKTEEVLHKELANTYTAVEEKKNLIKKLEAREEDLKIKKLQRSDKQKELSADNKELQDKLKKLIEKQELLEKTISLNINKQSDFDAKIKELQEKINLSKKNEIITVGNAANTRMEKTKLMTENNIVDLTDKATFEPAKDIKRNEVKPLNSNKKTSYDFFLDSDDSEESEDEFKIQNLNPNKSNSAATVQKKPIYNIDVDISRDTHNIEKTQVNQSQSDKLFNELLTQKSVDSPKNETVFKVPQTYMTPFRKKSTQLKKY